MNEAGDWLTFTLALCGLLTVLVGWLKWVRPRYRRGRTQFVAARDSIIGRPAVYDSITGAEREPALPGVGVRLANTEEHLGTLAQAVATLAESHALLEDHTLRISNHEDRIKDLEEARVERIVGKVESAAAFRAMEAATKAQPDDDGGFEP